MHAAIIPMLLIFSFDPPMGFCCGAGTDLTDQRAHV